MYKGSSNTHKNKSVHNKLLVFIWQEFLLKGTFEHTAVFFPLDKNLFKVNILQVFLLRTEGKYLCNINEMAVTIVYLGVSSNIDTHSLSVISM